MSKGYLGIGACFFALRLILKRGTSEGWDTGPGNYSVCS